MKTISFKTISKKQLSDTITPVGLYLRLRDKYNNSILLESSDYHSKEDSFSFICVKPLISMKVKDNVFTTYRFDNKIDEQIINKNFNHLFNSFNNSISLKCKPNIKFFNGLYGYTNYDSVKYFENIKLKAKKTSSSIPEIQYSFYKFIIAINHFNNELTIIENIAEKENSQISDIENIVNSQSIAKYNFSLNGIETSNINDETFKKNVNKAKKHCKQGDVFQLVLSRQFQQKFTGDEFNVYRSLRSINPSPYLFYFDYGNFKLIGSSPETQIKINNKKAVINPIAGTFKRTGNNIEDKQLAKNLINDSKENAEHVMLVDLARNDLSKHSTNVKVETFKKVQYFSHVIHLLSTVSGEINADAIDIIGDTFPAGTLSGAPKYKAIELIDNYENKAEGFMEDV